MLPNLGQLVTRPCKHQWILTSRISFLRSPPTHLLAVASRAAFKLWLSSLVLVWDERLWVGSVGHVTAPEWLTLDWGPAWWPGLPAEPGTGSSVQLPCVLRAWAPCWRALWGRWRTISAPDYELPSKQSSLDCCPLSKVVQPIFNPLDSLFIYCQAAKREYSEKWHLNSY